MNDTIALWEEEIAEANRSHFFENTARAIDYLMESIELDYKLIEAGIITEADEENSSSDNNSENEKQSDDNSTDKQSVFKNVGEKIKAVYEKIKYAIRGIKSKIRKFIVEKMDQFVKNDIIKKFASGKIDPEKMAEKLNKTVLLDCKGVLDRYYGGTNRFDISIMNDESIRKRYEEDESLRQFAINFSRTVNNAKNITKNHEEYIKKIDPKNAQNDIIKLYEETKECVNKLEELGSANEKVIDAQSNKVSNIKNKEDLKVQKEILKIMKLDYQNYQSVTKMFVDQANNLQAIMVAFAAHGGNEEGEEKKED